MVGCEGSEPPRVGTGIALLATAVIRRQVMFDTINWDDLRVFLCAARAGNLSQTAKRLRLDHSTVSRRIAQMEASLGIAVFER
ncbi:LysR family transcriptional regulator, partial [Streptomyces sp. EL5]|nr:LysR family transcriptional regulator [Streptomyces sp. EL5]